jgi:NAD-dependent deacetylase
MAPYRNIVVLTGAGLSAESGIATFRDRDGIWAKYDVEEVANSRSLLRRNPQLVHDFYNHRRRGHANVQPNAAHFALAKLEREHAGTVTVITQNVDALHEAAGSKNLIHMHGELLKALCALGGAARVERRSELEDTVPRLQQERRHAPRCRLVRRDALRDGADLRGTDRRDLFVSIGTSGNVYPAVGFVAATREAGAHTVELNLEPSEAAHRFHETIHGPATRIVPAFVDRLLSS